MQIILKSLLTYYTAVDVDTELLKKQQHTRKNLQLMNEGSEPARSAFGKRKLEDFVNYEEAYHQFIVDIVAQQVRSTNLVLRGTGVKRIFVDGGFSKNPIYMYLMSEAFPLLKCMQLLLHRQVPLGAALVIHQHWNNKPLPSNIIDMKLYSVTHQTSI